MRRPDANHQDVSLRDDLAQVPGLGVANGDSGMVPLQQLGHGSADDLAAT